ncbi:MAG: sn-glycerol-3-phosphate ABC transporter ATP-binding protein UgpC [Clostridia bacterium]|nr:sn-glycerol-3-phosphate ABC transporter ATP-binding protein UgpC [Clostridia bacterium]
MASLSFKNVKKVYDGGVVAVHDFNLEIADKEFIVLVGPSGCGKSTTLRMVAGLESISGGELYIGDKLVNDVAPKDRDIAMVFQNYALYPHMTVYNNMAFAIKLRKVPRDEVDRRVREAAKILGITEYLQRKPKALSGGQRQRVAIGRAIVRDPKVFLLDEPLSNLDAKLRAQTRTEISKLHQRLGTTFIYVTHDQVEAMTLGDRIVIMKDGYVQQVGTPIEVFHFPYNIFVAGFIGTPQMNFFDAKLIKETSKLSKNGSEYYVELLGKKIKLNDKLQEVYSKKNISEMPVTLGIRAENIEIVPQGTPSSIDTTVDVSEMLGNEVHVHVTINDKDVAIRLPALDAEAESISYKPGDKISLLLTNKALHLFDKESEVNLYYK